MNRTIQMNPLSSPTFRFLKMNDATVENVTVEKTVIYKETLPSAIQKKEGGCLTELKTGAGEAFSNLVKEFACANYLAETEGKPKDPLRMKLDFKAGDGGVFDFLLEEGAALTVIMDLTSEEEGDGALQVKYDLQKNASLTLVQIMRMGKDFRFLNDIGGNQEERSEVRILHLFLSGDKIYQGCRSRLTGAESRFEVKAAYDVAGRSLLDMNYEAEHLGKKTESDIVAKGVLADEATKTFRATIDFVKGSSGSKGAELEDALLIDGTVVNRTIPVILCTEEDVEGEHGATIGELDEGTLFYLQSRGLDKEAIFEMMRRARIREVIDQIPDEETVHMLIGDESDA